MIFVALVALAAAPGEPDPGTCAKIMASPHARILLIADDSAAPEVASVFEARLLRRCVPIWLLKAGQDERAEAATIGASYVLHERVDLEEKKPAVPPSPDLHVYAMKVHGKLTATQSGVVVLDGEKSATLIGGTPGGAMLIQRGPGNARVFAEVLADELADAIVKDAKVDAAPFGEAPVDPDSRTETQVCTLLTGAPAGVVALVDEAGAAPEIRAAISQDFAPWCVRIAVDTSKAASVVSPRVSIREPNEDGTLFHPKIHAYAVSATARVVRADGRLQTTCMETGPMFAMSLQNAREKLASNDNTLIPGAKPNAIARVAACIGRGLAATVVTPGSP